jgi:hypothetical protein
LAGRPLILVATPCFGGVVTQAYMLSVLKLFARAPAAGFDATLSLLGHDALVSRARSTLVGTFLDNAAATHLLFIDADIAFEPAQVERLLAADKDFAGALYPLKHIDWERIPERVVNHGEDLRHAGLNYVGTFCEGEALRRDGDFATAVYAGGGFQLIRRGVFERMIAAYPETRYAKVHAHPKPVADSPHLYALFDCLIDPESGAYLSEDYAFCRRWRAIGGDIWLDCASRLTHVGANDYAGDFAGRVHSLG